MPLFAIFVPEEERDELLKRVFAATDAIQQFKHQFGMTPTEYRQNL